MTIQLVVTKIAILGTSAWESASIHTMVSSERERGVNFEWNFFVLRGQKIPRNKGFFKLIGNSTDYVRNSTCFPFLIAYTIYTVCARRSLSWSFYHAGPTVFKLGVPPSRFWAGKTLRWECARTPKRFILRVPRLPFYAFVSQYDGSVARGSLAVLCRLRTVFDAKCVRYIAKRISRSRLCRHNNRQCISHNFPYFEVHDKRTFWLYRTGRPPSFARL